MLPVVAIVGRPNVGKSTLFNRLTRTRDAVISDTPGTTRDRQFGQVNLLNRRFIIVDTGGITDEIGDVDKLITKQALQAMQEADKILFVIDGKAGIMPEDMAIAKMLRRLKKPIYLAVNKTEGLDPDISVSDAFELNMNVTPIAIAAVHGSGISNLIETLFPEEMTMADDVEYDEKVGIKFAIVGRPNVGKSTLTNRMLGEERVIVHDAPGTTRDSIAIPFIRHDKQYTLIDTAGVRKRKKMSDVPEKFSVIKTLQAIEEAHVALFVIDARIGVSDQDLKLLGFIVDCGTALVIAVNKWDGMSEDDREHARATIDRQLGFVNFARIHFISALHGSGVGNLFESIDEAFTSATKKLSTPMLTRLLEQAQEKHSPPLVKGRRIKLRYAHPGGSNPPTIVIHGNQLPELPESYKKFLSHFFQQKLDLWGTPVHVLFKSGENPFDKRTSKPKVLTKVKSKSKGPSKGKMKN